MRVKIADLNVPPQVRTNDDVTELAELIGRDGMLDPIQLSSGCELVHGYRRLLALKLLGVEELEVVDEGARGLCAYVPGQEPKIG